MSDKLPHDLDEHIDHIDAALFTGDAFHDVDNIRKLRQFIRRWDKQLEENLISIIEEDKNEL